MLQLGDEVFPIRSEPLELFEIERPDPLLEEAPQIVEELEPPGEPQFLDGAVVRISSELVKNVLYLAGPGPVLESFELEDVPLPVALLKEFRFTDAPASINHNHRGVWTRIHFQECPPLLLASMEVLILYNLVRIQHCPITFASADHAKLCRESAENSTTKLA